MQLFAEKSEKSEKCYGEVRWGQRPARQRWSFDGTPASLSPSVICPEHRHEVEVGGSQIGFQSLAIYSSEPTILARSASSRAPSIRAVTKLFSPFASAGRCRKVPYQLLTRA